MTKLKVFIDLNAEKLFIFVEKSSTAFIKISIKLKTHLFIANITFRAVVISNSVLIHTQQ